jgi:hypothetical protein
MRSRRVYQDLELDFRTLRKGAPGEQLEAMVRDLARMLDLKVDWSGRGADEGRDLIFVEMLRGPLIVEEVRWLVQCKDHAQSGKSVRTADVGSIIDRVNQHRTNGFLLATTTTPSTGLKKLLVLLCHKMLVRLDNLCVRVEILTRGGGLWVSNPNQTAIRRGSPPMLKPSP